MSVANYTCDLNMQVLYCNEYSVHSSTKCYGDWFYKMLW